MGRLFSTLAISLAVIWTVLVIALVRLTVLKEERLVNQIALSQARALFQIFVDMRAWSAGFGGVYVPVGEGVRPNPYLVHPLRDIVTLDGMELTLVNPATMTRQISDITFQRHGVQARITSLTPLRPANTAIGWESEALRSFVEGEPSFWELVHDDSGGHFFHYMEPLFLEQACTGCHGAGASLQSVTGPLRGGISLVIPVDDLVGSREEIRMLNRISFVALWLVGLFVIAGLALALDTLRPTGRTAFAGRERTRRRPPDDL